MNPYLRNESEAEQFDNTVNIALKLFAKGKRKRQMAEKDLLTLGAKSVRPIAYTIELSLWDKSMSDDDINGSCNIYVNEWAQELIFKVMDAEGEEKQKKSDGGDQ